MQVWSIGEDGIQEALAAADDAGLFQEIDYEQPTNIADASTAQVTINVDGETYVHSAYALGIGGGLGDDGRPKHARAPGAARLHRRVARRSHLPGPTGDPGIFEPSEFGIEALVVDDLSAYGTDGIEPTVVDWPADAGVRLADAATCTVVSAADVGDALLQPTSSPSSRSRRHLPGARQADAPRHPLLRSKPGSKQAQIFEVTTICGRSRALRQTIKLNVRAIFGSHFASEIH